MRGKRYVTNLHRGTHFRGHVRRGGAEAEVALCSSVSQSGIRLGSPPQEKMGSEKKAGVLALIKTGN